MYSLEGFSVPYEDPINCIMEVSMQVTVLELRSPRSQFVHWMAYYQHFRIFQTFAGVI